MKVISRKSGCFRYHKGTDFQANHNGCVKLLESLAVVLDTTKVQIFKQITTYVEYHPERWMLFQIPQRYRFSSKSQPYLILFIGITRCFRYHKGTDFQANHNELRNDDYFYRVVLDTTKVQIFKQITTINHRRSDFHVLFQIPQRYRFSSKSQHVSTS